MDDPGFDRRNFFRRLFLRGLDEVDKRAGAVGERFQQAMGKAEDAARKALPPSPPHAVPDAPDSADPGESMAGSGDAPVPDAGTDLPGYPAPPIGRTHARGAMPLAEEDEADASLDDPDHGDPPAGGHQPGAVAVAVSLPLSLEERYLRPPGAAGPLVFEALCSRCGHCVAACPAKCIAIDPAIGEGAPHILPRLSPCVVCDDLSCMKVCPTGALELVPRAQIRMGRAVVDFSQCLRDHEQDCRLCVNACPFGEAALGVDAGSRIEVRSACTGCGVCEHYCPTEPASIWIQPAP